MAVAASGKRDAGRRARTGRIYLHSYQIGRAGANGFCAGEQRGRGEYGKPGDQGAIRPADEGVRRDG